MMWSGSTIRTRFGIDTPCIVTRPSEPLQNRGHFLRFTKRCVHRLTPPTNGPTMPAQRTRSAPPFLAIVEQDYGFVRSASVRAPRPLRREFPTEAVARAFPTPSERAHRGRRVLR